MKNKNQNLSEANVDDKHHLEKLEILQKSKEIVGKQLFIDGSDGSLKVVDELKELVNRQIEDPSEKYDLYYNKIKNLLRRYLPKGKGFESERKIIYEEQNIFLTRGKAKNKSGKRGADSRMSYNDDMGEMAIIVTEWILTNMDPVDLYISLYQLNKKYGYGHQQYDETSISFQNSMDGL